MSLERGFTVQINAPATSNCLYVIRIMNGSLTNTDTVNSSFLTDVLKLETIQNNGIFAKHEFIYSNPWTAFPTVLFLFSACSTGTFGNILILLAVLTYKEVRTVESMFIVNLACSDLYVTMIADPMSIVGKLEGEHFFDSLPGLCQTVASLCTISCVTSLMTIAMMSLNRYFYICRQDDYRRLFTKRNCFLLCLSLYGIGTILVLLNTAGVGDHSFDRKSLECIWDRMATYPYTVVFSVTLVWIPLLVTGTCYLRIYIYVRSHRRKIVQQQSEMNGTIVKSRRKQKLQLAKTLFIIYAVFVTCWAPYAILIVVDSDDTFPHEVHVFITMFAHLHPSLNWLIYYLTNKRFAEAYRYLLSCGKHVSTYGGSSSSRVFQQRLPRNINHVQPIDEDLDNGVQLNHFTVRTERPVSMNEECVSSQESLRYSPPLNTV